MKHPYTKEEDQIILRGIAEGKTFTAIAEELPGRSKWSANQRARTSLGYVPPGVGRKTSRLLEKEPNTVARKCLRCANPFNAAIDDVGKLLERICKPCKGTNDWQSGGGMI